MPPQNGAIGRTIAILTNHYRMPGAAYGTGVSVAHALRCLKRTKYDDNPSARLRRNVILYGPPASCKTTISGYCLFTLFGAYELGDPVGSIVGRAAPTVLNASAGWQRQKGSVDHKGGLIPPLLPEADWIWAPELMSALGHSPQNRSERMEEYNMAFEEGRITVSLIKMFTKAEEDRRQIAADIPAGAGYTYDPERCILSVSVRAAFVGCSRFLPKKLFQEMEASGYWSRHSIEEFRPTDAEARAAADSKFGPQPTQAEVDACKAKWLDLWNTTFERVDAPPAELVAKVISWFNNHLDQVGQETERGFADLASSRDDINVMQLLTAAAIERISASRTQGDRSPIPAILYAPEDAEIAKRWLSGRLAHMRNAYDDMKTEAEAGEVDKSFRVLTNYLRDLRKHEVEYDSFESKDFVDFFMGNAKAGGERTARRHLAKLKRERVVLPLSDSPGHYAVDARALALMGLPLRTAQVESHAEPEDGEYNAAPDYEMHQEDPIEE